jgi:hypothetical protein
MKMHRAHLAVCLSLMIIFLFFAVSSRAQQSVATATNAIVPPLVNFSGVLTDSSGKTLTDTVGVTFSLYLEQQGGAPLWVETQNVQPDAAGRYTVMLGAATSTGLPSSLFVTGEAHWVGVQVQGQEEQPRVFLVSAPYALKAGDAETIGGLPPSAFMLATAATSAGSASASSSSSAASPSSPAISAKGLVKPPLSGSGTTNYIPIWTSSTALGNSNIQQSGDYVGIGTSTPGSTLDVNGNVNSSAAYKIGGLTVLSRPDSLGTDTDIAVGYEALGSDTYGLYDTASGAQALYNNTMGYYDTASGYQALYNNTTGYFNTASGAQALYSNTTASNNTASGYQALYYSTASNNTASGYQSLHYNTTGGNNTASGASALAGNTTGNNNTADGFDALRSNNTGSSNTASGYEALYNATASDNTATGAQALYADTTGSDNTASGYSALFSNTTGSNNTAGGFFAMWLSATGSQDTAYGYGALSNNSSGNNNIAIGYEAAINVSGANSNNIHIGSEGSSGDSGTIRIGTSGTQTSFFGAGISGVNVGSAVPVMIDSATGQLGTVSSSRRFKEDIQDMGDASRDLLRLRPVTFRYIQPSADGSKPIQYGLIAEEVADVYPDLVAHSADGQIETVKYQVLDPMLLNEVQRQQIEIQSLQERLSDLKAAIARMTCGPALP